jgi:hypothetical protein
VITKSPFSKPYFLPPLPTVRKA